jgi:formylglycine-generating enzyme required for sulfatase activity
MSASAVRDLDGMRRRWPLRIAIMAAGGGLIAGGGWWFAVRKPARAVHVLPGMVAIDGARFHMGSTRAEAEATCAELAGCKDYVRTQLEREQPPREVTVTAFQIDAHEVTNQEYAAYLALVEPLLEVRDDSDDHYPRFVIERSSGLKLLDMYPEISGVQRVPGGFAARAGREPWPVELVTWDGASHYCRQLGKRLPTEAEWELAAAGAEHHRFAWGAAPPRCDTVAFGRGDPGDCPKRALAPEPVATAAQDVTATGVHDLGGNVGEWVQDQFALPYYGDCGTCADPVSEQPVSLAEDFRIFRGGTYLASAWVARTTTRSKRQRTEVMQGLGFRCVAR